MIAAATKRRKRPLRGTQNVGLRAGRILNRYVWFLIGITRHSA